MLIQLGGRWWYASDTKISAFPEAVPAVGDFSTAADDAGSGHGFDAAAPGAADY